MTGVLIAVTDYTVVVAVIGGAATILAGAITVALSRRADRLMAAQEARRERKTKVYDDFLEFWFRVLMHQALGVPEPSQEEIGKFLVDFTRECIPWASDGFIREYAEFRRRFYASQTGKPDAPIATSWLLWHFERVLYEIRSDLGHDNRKLREKTILALWINDIDKYTPGVLPEDVTPRAR